MSRGARGVARIQVERRSEVSVREAFNYKIDPGNWPAYSLRSCASIPTSRWREPGDRARLTLRMRARRSTST